MEMNVLKLKRNTSNNYRVEQFKPTIFGGLRVIMIMSWAISF